MRTRMTGQASFCLALPSLCLAGHAVSLLGYRVSRLVEHFFDLRQRHDLGIVVDVDGLRRDIDPDVAYAFQFSNGSLDRMLAMLARNVGGNKRCRFHETSPPLIQVNHLKSKRYNPPLQYCSRSQLHVVDEPFYGTPFLHYICLADFVPEEEKVATMGFLQSCRVGSTLE